MDITELYHCTNAEALLKILNAKYFKPSFCLENYDNIGIISIEGGGKDVSVGNMAFAVVCFADLLPSELSGHMKNFGANSFICMSKEWAISKTLTSVIYCDKESFFSSGIVNFLTKQAIILNHETNKIDKSLQINIRNVTNAINYMYPFVKQYRGKYFEKKKHKFSAFERQFYLEREWRYVPLVTNHECYYLDETLFRNKTFRNAKEKELVKNGYALRFEWKDVINFYMPGKYYNKKIFNMLSNTFRVSELDVKKKFLK